VLALQQFLFDGKNKQELWKKLKTALLVDWRNVCYIGVDVFSLITVVLLIRI